MKLIFNEQIGDEIIARGDGKMNIKLDQLDQLTMIGKYSIATGSKYNFVDWMLAGMLVVWGRLLFSTFSYTLKLISHQASFSSSPST